MLRHIARPLLLAAAVSMAGCSYNGGFHPFAANGDQEHAQLAAYAATAKYPGDMKVSSDFHAVALVNSNNDTLKIYNFSDQPLTDANVWVDKTFVTHVITIPPRGSVTLPFADFYDSVGGNMARSNFAPNGVMIESGNNMFSVWGPARE